MVALPVQYRMSADIQDLANELFYQGQLRCGTPGVAEGALAVPAHGAAAVAALPGWLQQVRRRGGGGGVCCCRKGGG